MMKVRYEHLSVELSKRGTDGLIAYMAAVCEALRKADKGNAHYWKAGVCVIGDLASQPAFTFGSFHDLPSATPKRPFIVRADD